MLRSLRKAGTVASSAIVSSVLAITMSLAMLTVGSWMATGPAYASTGASRISIVVSPHPDDEYAAWSLVQHSPDNYPVFVFATEGQSTLACETVSQAQGSVNPITGAYQQPYTTGPYRYQGGSSPVGQPNDGELYPGDGLVNPWQGVGTWSCSDARINSTIRFLNIMASSVNGGDPTLSYLTPTANPARICFGPSGNGLGTAEPLGANPCVRMFVGAADAAIFFDLGDKNGVATDQDVSRSDVAWAVEMVNEGIQAGVFSTNGYMIPHLPIGNVISASFYNALASKGGTPGYLETSWPSSYSSTYATANSSVPCKGNNEHAHWAVAAAIYQIDMVPNVMVKGRTCSGDPRTVTNVSVDQGTSGDGNGTIITSGVWQFSCNSNCNPMANDSSWGGPLGDQNQAYGWMSSGINEFGIFLRDSSDHIAADSGWSDISCSDVNNQGGYGRSSGGPGVYTEDLGSCNQAFWEGTYVYNTAPVLNVNSQYDYYSPESYDKNG